MQITALQRFNEFHQNIGKLLKCYLINTSYGNKIFVENEDWYIALKQCNSYLVSLAELYQLNLFECLDLSLQKYLSRFDGKEQNNFSIPKIDNFKSLDLYFKILNKFSNDLFGEADIQIIFLDLFSEICELHEELQTQINLNIENLSYELGDVFYLLIKISVATNSVQTLYNR